jgi:hypothetical protein
MQYAYHYIIINRVLAGLQAIESQADEYPEPSNAVPTNQIFWNATKTNAINVTLNICIYHIRKICSTSAINSMV